MIQRQYVYKDENDFIRELSEVRAESISVHASKTLIRIFSAETDNDFLTNLCHTIDKNFPEALYVGCTTNANILDGKFSENGICITFSMYTDPRTDIFLVQQNLEGYSLIELLDVARDVRNKRGNLKAVELLITSYGMMETDLTKAFEEYRSNGIVVYGGGAYTGDSNADSFVFAKGFKPDSKALVAVCFSGDALKVSARHISGWKPLGHDFRITSAEGNVLKELNDKPAFDIYTQYLDIQNDENFEDNAIEFPLMCRTKDGKDIMRTPIYSRGDGSIVLFSEIDTFDSVRLSYGDKSHISEEIIKEAKIVAEFRPEAIMLFSCVARRAFWAEDIEKESAIFQRVAPTSGFYTSGEIMSEGEKLYHHNETLLIVGIREGEPDMTLPEVEISETGASTNKSFISRFAKFISVATQELEETNKELDDMVKSVEESRKLAEDANQAKSDFLANMSHEIRTPINAILGFDTMIMRECEDEAIINYADDIQRAGNSLLSIINDILDLSKIESGKMTIVNEGYEIKGLVNDIVNMMTLKAGEKGLKVEVDVDKDIPSMLFGDDVRIRQIIINLMNNAVKYTESGSVTLAIHGTKKGETELLHVEVRDTGIGIKPEDMDKLFEKFARIEEQRNHKVEGTGLGMNITITLLSMMNSKLNVQSEYGKGSCFSFDLNQKIIKDEPVGDIMRHGTEKKKKTAYKSSFMAPDAKILLVDDNKMNREVILALLKKTKIQFDQADGGLTCLDRTLEKKYDLILLDHMMPDLDGVKTLHRIREDDNNPNRKTKIICMTANAITGAMEEYISEGFDDYISKPVKPDVLEELLAGVLPDELVVRMMGPAVTDSSANTGDIGENNEIENMPEINGIDYETAFKNLPSAELVLNTMDMFMMSADSEAEHIMECFGIINSGEASEEDINKEVDDYRVKVHAMKSSALTIGAVMVSNLAKFLEYSARDKNIDNIKSVTVPFINEWNALVSRMREALKKDASDSSSSEPREYDMGKITELLNDLTGKIAEMDIDSADEIMKNLENEGLGDLAGEAFMSLKQAVMNIEPDKVGSLAEQIINNSKG